ncbi:MAG: PilN domain-containing protein [Pseudomonadota bacterium]|nr:PilN domain-containing protein [Pseudomonadota bacterium]
MKMKPLRIDFAPPSLARTLFHTSRPAFALAVIALVLAGLAAGQAWRLAEQRRLDAEQIARVVQHHAVPVAAAPVQAKLSVSAAQAAAVNAAILQLNLPWHDLQQSLGDATPATVALLALEPDARKRTVRITAEVRTSDEMIDYIEKLQQQKWFTAVALTHHETNDVDPNKPIRFQVEAQWAGQP